MCAELRAAHCLTIGILSASPAGESRRSLESHALQGQLHVRQAFRERHWVRRNLHKSELTIEFNRSAHRGEMSVQAYLLVAKLAGNIQDSNHQYMPELVSPK